MSAAKLRLAFMGTPDFALPTLDALVEAGHEVVAIYTQPPREAGRGKQPRPSPVQRRAEALGLEVRTPLNFKGEADRQAFVALGLDAAVVAAYGLILPGAILDAPRLGCLNVHASLLPRWRGAAPIQRAIMAGDSETGVSIMQVEAGLDAGPVLAVERTPIGPDDTAGTLHDRLAAIGARLMVEVLDGLAAGEIQGVPQPEEGVTYATKIDKAEARIDWTRPPGEIGRLIRALSPVPGAWFELNGERVKVHAAHPLVIDPTHVPPPGTTLSDDLIVRCGDGFLRLVTLQRAGRVPMDAESFLRGRPVPAGTDLS